MENLFEQSSLQNLNESDIYFRDARSGKSDPETPPHFDNPEEELKYFEDMLKSDPNSSLACLGLGEIFFRKAEYHSAKVMFEWSVANNSANKAAYASLRKTNMLLGLRPDDNSLFKEDKKESADTDALIAEAAALMKDNNYYDALVRIEAAEGLFNGHLSNPVNKDFAASFFNLKGYIFLGLNEIDSARSLFEKALTINPQSSQACTGLGKILFLEGLRNAKTMFEWGVKNNPENILAIEGLAQVNSLLNVSDNDLPEQTASANEPGLEEQLDRIYQLFEANKFDDALKLLTIAENLLPEKDMKLKSAVETLKGFSYLGLNNLENARNYFEQALYDEPDSSDACAGLGEVFQLTGFAKEAKIMFEWALRYNPGNKFAKAGLSKVNSALGLENFHNSLIEEYN